MTLTQEKYMMDLINKKQNLLREIFDKKNIIKIFFDTSFKIIKYQKHLR